MTNHGDSPANDQLRATRRGPDGLTHARPLPQTEVANPCPVCGNTAHLQDDWRPEPGYDRRIRQYKCLLGHEHYTVPRHSGPIAPTKP